MKAVTIFNLHRKHTEGIVFIANISKNIPVIPTLQLLVRPAKGNAAYQQRRKRATVLLFVHATVVDE